jgi:hypothetical protein
MPNRKYKPSGLDPKTTAFTLVPHIDGPASNVTLAFWQRPLQSASNTHKLPVEPKRELLCGAVEHMRGNVGKPAADFAAKHGQLPVTVHRVGPGGVLEATWEFVLQDQSSVHHSAVMCTPFNADYAMNKPSMIEPWLAFHRLGGIEHFHIYGGGMQLEIVLYFLMPVSFCRLVCCG